MTASGFERTRASIGPATVILLAAALAWIGIIIWASDMGAMPGTMDLTLPVFIVMWALMMAAMMLPSAMPMITLYIKTIQTHRWLRMATFGSGYLLAWALAGVPAFGLAWIAGEVAVEYPGWATAGAVVIFVAAGIYQLTPFKHRCLKHCRSPLAHLMHYGSYHGRLRDLRAGSHHGFFCLGCCWGLMLLMIGFGVMNIAAMIGLAAVIAIEKQWRYGEQFSKATGVAAFVLAAAVIWFPELAPGIITESILDMDGMGM